MSSFISFLFTLMFFTVILIIVMRYFLRVRDFDDAEDWAIPIGTLVMAIVFFPMISDMMFNSINITEDTYFFLDESPRPLQECAELKTVDCEDEGIDLTKCKTRTEIEGPYYAEEEITIYEIEVCVRWED